MDRDVCDIITMILYRWPYANLVMVSHLFVLLLERPAGDYNQFILDSSERQFAESVIIPLDDASLNYRAYYKSIYHYAQGNEFNDDIVLKLRACFIVGLVYDLRIRRFCLTNHGIHDKIGSKPTPKEKTFEFIEKIESLASSFLDGTLSIEVMTYTAIQEWQSNVLFQ